MGYTVVGLVSAWCIFGLAADLTDGLSLDHCEDGGFLDIRENTENNFTCKDIDTNATVIWWIKWTNSSSLVFVATCTTFNCSHVPPDQFAVQRSPRQSQLVYQQQNRTADANASIQCENFLQQENISKTSCNLNVISPANLSDCTVVENRENGTVNGSCHFEHVYSARRELGCMWYQTNSSGQGQTEHVGHISKENYTNGEVYYRGECNLSISGQRWDDGNYSYCIDFYPGPGLLPVPIGLSASDSTPDSGQCTTPSAGTTQDPPVSDSTPDSEQSTASSAGTTEESRVSDSTRDSGQSVAPSAGSIEEPPTPDSTPDSEQSTDSTVPAGTSEGEDNTPDRKGDSFPIFIIAGGAGAAVVVVIVVVVIVVVVTRRRRRRRRKPGNRKKKSTEDDFWEEHINSAYVSSDDLQIPGLDRGVDTRRLAAAANGDYEDADIQCVPFSSSLESEADGFDGYAVIDGSTRRQAGAVPYSVVDCFKSGTGPNENGTPPGKKPATDTYAVVDKSGKRNGQPRTGPADDRAGDDAEPEEKTYSHLQLSRPATKPVVPKKPYPREKVMQPSPSEDVYNRLKFN